MILNFRLVIEVEGELPCSWGGITEDLGTDLHKAVREYMDNFHGKEIYKVKGEIQCV